MSKPSTATHRIRITRRIGRAQLSANGAALACAILFPVSFGLHLPAVGIVFVILLVIFLATSVTLALRVVSRVDADVSEALQQNEAEKKRWRSRL